MNKSSKIPELLAPAGSFDSLYAAVKGGADAVYFGGMIANARNAAKNFADEEISRAVKFLRDNGKYSYITLNILHTDRELTITGELLKFAEHCYLSGADAFIIQDIGLSRIIKRYFPDIKIHASTQAAGHNLCSAQKFFELGFSRMVISRESDRDNLKELINNAPLDIEMFVHGALCSSYSGRCFMSFSMGNTRSANRGMCAQPCRMRYDCRYNNGYALSLKDLCLAGHIKEIIELAPSSLKIEGRMKTPEYVYNVCKIYRTCLDESRDATKNEIDFLSKIFSRQGFTDGYFTNNLGVSMYGVRTEENKIESMKYSSSLLKGGVSRASLEDAAAGVCRCLPAQHQIPQTPVSGCDRCRPLSKWGIENDIGSVCKNIKINPKLCLIFNSSEQFQKVSDFIKTDEIFKRIYKIFLPIESLDNLKIPVGFEKITGARLPYVIFDSEREQVMRTLNKTKNAGISCFLADNIGHAGIVEELGGDVELFGDFGLNITNSYTLEEYKKMGFKDVILSPELNFAQIRDINKSINCGIIAYGRTHVMISENDIIKNSGYTSDYFYLTDKTGAKFYVSKDFGNRNIIYNSVPVYLADKKDLYKNLGLFFISLNFTDETPEQVKKIISDYAINKNNIKPPEKFTRGYK